MHSTVRRTGSRPGSLVALLSVTLGIAAVGNVAAQEAPPVPVTSPEARGVAQAVTAAELADWGRERRDAGALVMAARLLAEVPMRQVGPEAAVMTPESLLAEASALAPDNAALQDAIARLRDPALRGVHSSTFGAGPVFTARSLKARESWVFQVEARGNEVLRIAAIGDGDTNIDLTVTEPSGRVVCQDRLGDHYPVCTISPQYRGTMRIDIVNRGDIWTKVQVLSN
ncbi:MAG: hypothetical protein ACOH1F_00925 [Brevundimonas sp.]